jgi:hypothetical protein
MWHVLASEEVAMIAHLFHAAHVAKHGGIFTLAGTLIGFALAYPYFMEEEPCVVARSLTCTTYKNIFGTTGPFEEFLLPMLFFGLIGGLVGLSIGKAVVKLGWISEDKINPE